MSIDELKNNIRKLEDLKVIIIVTDDYTTKKYVGDEINSIEVCGLFGFAISNNKMYFWLRENDKYVFKALPDKDFKKLKELYVHYELGDFKLGEWK
ncbi:MAG: hypothetical protein ACP5IZ_09400 [Thermoprotei archaeon]